MSDVQLIEQVARASIVTFLILALYGGYKGWWMWRRDCVAQLEEKDRQYADLEKRHERLRREKDAWMQTALKSAGVAFALSEEKAGGHEDR